MTYADRIKTNSFHSFRYVYDYCTSTSAQSGSTRTTGKPVARNSGNRSSAAQDGANIIGEELYNNLKTYLKNYLANICEVNRLIRSFNFS